MIWLTWRQQRLEMVLAGVLMARISVFLLATGSNMAAAYQHMGVSACLAHNASPDACQSFVSAFQARFSSLSSVITWLNFLPLVVGVLLAAPWSWTWSTARTAWPGRRASRVGAGWQ